MRNIIMRLRIADILLFIMLTFILIFPSYVSVKALSILAFFGYIFIMNILKKKKQNILHMVWAIVFFAVCYLSKTWAYYPNAVEEVLTNVLWSMLISIAIAKYVIIYDVSISTITKLLIPIACMLVINIFLNGTYSADSRLSVDINENTFGQICIGIGCFFLYCCIKHNWKNVLYDILLIVLVLALLLSGSRKALLSLGIYVIAFFLFETHNKNSVKILGKIIALIVLLIIGYFCLMKIDFLYNSIGNRVESLMEFWVTNDQKTDASAYSRSNMIKLAEMLFEQEPLHGVGLNNFKYLTRYKTYAHNNYYELVACTGIIGILVYYCPVIIFLFAAYKNWKLSKEDAIVPLAIILNFFINDIGAVSYFSMTTHVFLGVAIGMIYRVNRQKLITCRREE